MTSTFVLGGARSGKSRHGQALVEGVPGRLVYIATGQALDDEMEARIARHREDRGPRWSTLEAPMELVEAILKAAGEADAVLVDCLTLWLSNLMLAEAAVQPRFDALCRAIADCPKPLVLVANEVGMGIVPETSLGRRFRDEAGRLNQQVAATVDHAVLVAAGLPLVLK
ncbi:bifunctional adenosylcobinamide kinase/adenosylcobinamide-phosphate guanylyltransferase [Novosphingobium sp. ST904]|uniref:bifunctional adenosylcobinamide kinase/adenosylcobinamide-phosphate guanylyltransferase n=1 Tax=Novosphingobium sp. ST904 TaxID=1684385 RepID=UPI0006C8998E|nr:bifunctional adenosylcobinamide kinase/adenosylcobinamide-phosphate guanylyltransferase [Novosphingobium sp. ST904]KPH62820.1 cobalamin biosynthesis protein [Novosphingobium sp. ST904]TCM39232.1 adenosylcobinamide kinase /adenosylcobinamide-phosphate guanylyltransferase [Novosphingobium sp. ST904]